MASRQLHQCVSRTNSQGCRQGKKRRPRITMPMNPPWRLPRQRERAPPRIDQHHQQQSLVFFLPVCRLPWLVCIVVAGDLTLPFSTLLHCYHRCSRHSDGDGDSNILAPSSLAPLTLRLSPARLPVPLSVFCADRSAGSHFILSSHPREFPDWDSCVTEWHCLLIVYCLLFNLFIHLFVHPRPDCALFRPSPPSISFIPPGIERLDPHTCQSLTILFFPRLCLAARLPGRCWPACLHHNCLLALL